jgi:hypothetical protein
MKNKIRNKVQNRNKERRNHKNKERELRRKKQVQHNQEKKNGKKLWSIPQPEEYTFDSRGYKKLFHYTIGDNLPPILKYGIIFGDVMTDNFDGFNTPNLTTENQYHNPSNRPESHFDKQGDYYRLTIKCQTDPKKLINYGWFDKTYCKGINRNLTSQDPSHYGDIDKQYIYLGHITPSMIVEVKVWNNKTQYWDRPRKKEKEDLCLEYENKPYKHDFQYLPSQLRICGFQFNDFTGMVKKYHLENDHKDVWKDLYELSDFLCEIFKSHSNIRRYRKPILQYKKNVMKLLHNGTQDCINNLIYKVMDTFNMVVGKSHQIDPYVFGDKIRKKHEVFDGWVVEVKGTK